MLVLNICLPFCVFWEPRKEERSIKAKRVSLVLHLSDHCNSKLLEKTSSETYCSSFLTLSGILKTSFSQKCFFFAFIQNNIQMVLEVVL